MTRRIIAAATAGLFVFLGRGDLVAQSPPNTAPKASIRPANAPVRISGSFNWVGKKGPKYQFQGTLTPQGPNQWRATYTCVWNKKTETFTGVVTGNLENGTVRGEATMQKTNRQFRFEGQVRGGVWTCKHYETTKGKTQYTGDMTVRKSG